MRESDRESFHFFSPSGLPGVQAVHGTNVTTEFHRHIHNGFCIGIVLKGARAIYRGSGSTIIPERCLFVINPGEPHTCRPQTEAHSYFTVSVEAQIMKTVVSQISGKLSTLPHFEHTLLCDPELASGIYRFFALLADEVSSLERESALESVLSTLVIRYGAEPPVLLRTDSHIDAIKRVCEFIGANYCLDLSLEELSKVACLSPFYFQRLFLKNMGISPHDYLLQVRIRKARELLAQGDSISGVALRTGFADQSHFTRSFRRVIGTTPGDYICGTRTGPSLQSQKHLMQVRG